VQDHNAVFCITGKPHVMDGRLVVGDPSAGFVVMIATEKALQNRNRMPCCKNDESLSNDIDPGPTEAIAGRRDRPYLQHIIDAIDSIREYTRYAIGIAVPSIQAKYPEQARGNLDVRADIALPVVAMDDIIMISEGGSETGESRCLTSLFGA
jgi:hypothetical protein